MKQLFLFVLLALNATAQVKYEDILKGAGDNWLTYAGNYQGWRYSPLKQITIQNTPNMVAKWTYHVPEANALRSSPIVYKGVMYVTDSNAVHAIDARNGRLIWQYSDGRAKRKGVNRGAAILGDSVYFTTTDNYLVALDRQTGSLLFNRQFADVEKGVTSTSAPLVVKDKILVGSAGGDTGVRGFIAALSPSTGDEIWRTYTVPAKGEPGSETWSDLHEWGGAGTWLSGTFDPDSNTLFWTTGNPWPDFAGKPREGIDLYSCSVIALDLETGKLKWYFQFTPHDVHDWDAQSWPVLLEIPWQGATRKVVVHANRNGFFYILDRQTGQFLKATKLIDNITWASGIDDNGKPVIIPGKDPTPEGNWVCPSVKGATNWMGQSYNPVTGLLYILTLEECGMFTLSSQRPVPMKNFAGGAASEPGGAVILRAVDPKTGKRVWQYPVGNYSRMWTGTASTTTGVLFSGDDDGHLIALEARTGRHLWHYNVGDTLTASPVIYAVDGKEYVAVAAGTNVFSFGLFEPAVSIPLPELTIRKQ
jgi:alcohol dehydrogenase (cytochrome c)